MTHLAISQLIPFFDAITVDESKQLLQAALDNNQIRWIASDNDVNHFFKSLIDKFGEHLDFGIKADVDDVFQKYELTDEEIEDIIGKLN